MSSERTGMSDRFWRPAAAALVAAAGATLITAAVSEPGSVALLAFGFVGLCAVTVLRVVPDRRGRADEE